MLTASDPPTTRTDTRTLSDRIVCHLRDNMAALSELAEYQHSDEDIRDKVWIFLFQALVSISFSHDR